VHEKSGRGTCGVPGLAPTLIARRVAMTTDTADFRNKTTPFAGLTPPEGALTD